MFGFPIRKSLNFKAKNKIIKMWENIYFLFYLSNYQNICVVFNI
jgi:hypothetical protein